MIRDLTLKQEALVLDHKSVGMADGEKGVRTPDGERLDYRSARFLYYDQNFREGAPLQRMSEYGEWIENTGQILNHSAKARVQSRKIAQKLSQSLRESAQALRAEAIAVEALLKDSARTWQEWRDNLHAQVGATSSQ